MVANRKKSVDKKTPYSQVSDDQKVVRNWRKALGLFYRGEYSVAIIRCGTCVELAVNFAIRQELVIKRDLPLSFVDKLLKNANGLHNKFHNLLLPIMVEHEEYKALMKLWEKHIAGINKQRNDVVHRGEFRKRSTAEKAMTDTYVALIEIMKLYDLGSELKPLKA